MRTRPLFLAGTALALAGLLAACANSTSTAPGVSASSAAAGPSSAAGMMTAGMGSADDIAFSQLMISPLRNADTNSTTK